VIDTVVTTNITNQTTWTEIIDVNGNAQNYSLFNQTTGLRGIGAGLGPSPAAAGDTIYNIYGNVTSGDAVAAAKAANAAAHASLLAANGATAPPLTTNADADANGANADGTGWRLGVPQGLLSMLP